MRLLGLIPEPPFHPRSWSGSSANFFGALKRQGALVDAAEVRLSRTRDRLEKLRTVSWPLIRWKEQYNASVPRFEALSGIARSIAASSEAFDGILQVGAWFSAATSGDMPCFSYHDGNAAMAYRYYGRKLLSERRTRVHLEWERKVYTQMRGIFVMSNWLAASFRDDFFIPADKIHVVGAGINTGELPAVPMRDFSEPRFLYVGKAFARKGGPYLLRAFAEVKRLQPTAELWIVGPTLEIDQPGVTCYGFLSHAVPADVKKLNQLFMAATTVVLPSIYEPFGISLLEGMAFGLPCVASNRCAMPEIVQHGRTGFAVPAEDASELAAAMLTLARNPSDAQRMGSAGRRRVETDFTWDAVAGKIRTVLTDVYRL